MKRIVIGQAGGPEVMHVIEEAVPEPGQGEVLIEVSFAGLNFADVLARMGLYPDAPDFPATVGYEVSGTVQGVGDGVGEFSVGQRVVALTQFGGQSSQVVVPAKSVLPVPESMSLEEAAALPVNYSTAYHMLIHLGNLQSGQRVLIQGAAGGVGTAAVQLCLWKDAIIYATASAGKHEHLQQSGVPYCIDYRTQDFEKEVLKLTEGQGVHHALDPIGGWATRKSYRVLAATGRLYCFGASAMASGTKKNWFTFIKELVGFPFFHPFGLMDTNRAVFGVNLGHLWDETELLMGQLKHILALCGQGHLKPKVDSVFAFEDADQAHLQLQNRKNVGKVLLAP